MYKVWNILQIEMSLKRSLQPKREPLVEGTVITDVSLLLEVAFCDSKKRSTVKCCQTARNWGTASHDIPQVFLWSFHSWIIHYDRLRVLAGTICLTKSRCNPNTDLRTIKQHFKLFARVYTTIQRPNCCKRRWPIDRLYWSPLLASNLL